ncbi:hypothetical protein M422DRAFT_243988 [Sphaerobolus stellatus SS14]|nr:hypothetical protein M422DRAFT_243988 [Sphaerobolus stellatus SS14]
MSTQAQGKVRYKTLCNLKRTVNPPPPHSPPKRVAARDPSPRFKFKPSLLYKPRISAPTP